MNISTPDTRGSCVQSLRHLLSFVDRGQFGWTLVLRVSLLATISTSGFAQPPVLLYHQDFENPTGFVNDGGDINIFRTVNDNYAEQPAGFSFAQQATVETLFINGTDAFDTGYSDPSLIGGNYTISMQNVHENDLLGLSFDLGEFDFLVLQMDISSIDLDRFGAPFVPPEAVPMIEYSLFDNPGGGVGLGIGTPLASGLATGTASAPGFVPMDGH